MYRKFKMSENQEQQNIINRVSQLPVVVSAYDIFSQYYTKAKEYNSITKATLDTAEKSIKFAADQAKPVVSKLEKPIALADSAACRTLDLIQEKCPVVTKTPEEIAKETKELYNSKIQPIYNSTVQPTITRVSNAKDYGYEKVHAVKEYGVEKATQLMNTKYGQMLGSSVSKTLNVADQYVDYYLPSSNETEEETKPNSSDAMSTRVNKLSTKLKHRVHKMTLQQMEQVQKRTQDTLAHLNVVLDLVQVAKTNLSPTNLALRERLAAAQVKAVSLWEDLKKEETDENQTLENKSLILARQLTKQLMNVYNNSNQMLPSMPEQLQPAFEQSRQYVGDLYSQISQIKSIEDATTVVLTQVREKSKLIQDTMSALLEHAVKLQPLEWLFTEITIDDIFLEDDPDETRGDDDAESHAENVDSSYYQHRPHWMS